MDQRTVTRDALAKYLEQTLDINRFRDYCPNGLQVEGRAEIGRIVTGVTASLALLDAAIAAKADAVLVHHGYFWKGEDARVIGPKHKRLMRLLTNEINLFAYHLPLDMHPDMGNNACLARLLGLTSDGRFGEDDIGWLGVMQDPNVKTVGDLARHIAGRVGRTPLLIGDASKPLGRLGWCTGAAHNMLGEAINAGAAVYLSGEISEPVVHLARESEVAYIACGHHATERYGIQAVGAHLEKHFGLHHEFIDIDNPV